MTEQTESQRDTIVAWLEKEDNFQRATALSDFSGSHHNRGDANRRQAEQTERQALNDLAAAVNEALPRSMWDSKHAKQMLQRYLTLFRTTEAQASQPGFSLSRTDKVFGIKTVEDKLNSMCPHFIRLQSLYSTKMKEATEKDVVRARIEEKKKDKKPGKANTRGALHQEKAMGAADQKARQNALLKSADGAPEASRTKEPSAEDRITGNGYSLRMSSTKQRSEGEGSALAPKNGKKRAVSAKVKQQEQQTKQTKQTNEKETGRDDRAPELIDLASDEEEVPVVASRATSVNVGFRLRAPKSASSVDNNPKKRKLRRKNTPEGELRPVHEASKFPESVAKQSTTGAPKVAITKQVIDSDSLVKSAEKVSGETTDGPPTNTVSAGPEKESISPREVPMEVQSSPSSPLVDTASVAQSDVVQSSEVVPDAPAQSNQNYSEQLQFHTPDALRSTIAQVLSNKRANGHHHPGIRKGYRGSTDYAKEVTSPNSSNCPSQWNGPTAFIELRSAQAPLAGTDRSSTNSIRSEKSGNEGSPAVSNTTGNGAKATFVTGHLPPLLNERLFVDRDIILDRKRAFLRAKQLAFEQFRWNRENELQQLEVELLRREMKTRETFAQTEISLLRMYIRADIIQRMILAGASPEKVAERLKML